MPGGPVPYAPPSASGGDLPSGKCRSRNSHREGMPPPDAEGGAYGTGPPGMPRLDGFPTRGQMVARYEELTGWQPHDLEFYEVFAGLRFAVVMMRIAALVVEFELLPSD